MRYTFPLVWTLALPAAILDLTQSSVVAPAAMGGPERKAVAVLVEEIAKRTQIQLPVSESAPGPAIVIEPPRRSGPAEGYTIGVRNGRVIITGNDSRGVLFGVGHLLRRMDLSRDRIAIRDDFSITTAPKVPLRGHQLGYRPKTNSYDGWTLEMWDQYIRELAIFGANAIELIPPRSDDDADSPHFPAPQMETMTGMSRIIASYGLECWIWYPAMDKDYSDPATVEFALKEWGEVFRKLPRVDHVFVPGGDPGHTRPKYLMALLEKQTANLRAIHPKAKMWMSPQSFSKEWMDEWVAIMRAEPAWLEGVVYGPQLRMTYADLRNAVPGRYPIRDYPDITHSLRAQFPVPNWDLAYALTLEREPINPRPRDQAAIFRRNRPFTNGFLTYSEGCNDDVNKAVWSMLGWDPETGVEEILRQYARFFISGKLAEGFAQGLLALEENWRGPLLANAGVDRTLRRFQALERAAAPRDHLNWRFQQALYRAYYDAYVRERLLQETNAEARVIDALRQGRLDAAEQALDSGSVAGDLRARVFELAEALYQSIRMQLSAPRYRAQVGRGNTLDTLDAPLIARQWWKNQVAAIRNLPSDGERRRATEALLDRENPGPGGYYDDLGDPARRPHLVSRARYAEDPDFLRHSRIGFRPYPDGPARWWRFAETHFSTPLEMRYTGLDPEARYRLRVVMPGELSSASRRIALRLIADGAQVHDFIEKQAPVRPMEFDIPAEATRDGALDLRWEIEPNTGGSGRGCQISEVWLIRVR